MKGIELKAKLEVTGIPLTKIGEMIGMSQSNFSQAFKVADVKSGLIEKLCEALNLPITYFYPHYAEGNMVVNNCGDGNANVVGNNSTATACADTEALSKMAEQIEALVKANERLLEMNHELMMKLIQ